MKGIKISEIALVVCLCLLLASVAAYSATFHFHGYAVLYETYKNGNPCVIVSDGRGQYVDRELTGTTFGDKIEVT